MPPSARPDPARETAAVIAAATGGDEAAFATLVGRHRRELHVHCYRMLASFEEAEDVVQETFLRAWTRRDSFHGGSNFRAWLYKIATNASIDAQRRSQRQVGAVSSFMDIPWLQPYPDQLLDELPSAEAGPDAVTTAKETVELAFLAAVQLLPPQQRVALLVRDVLGWSAAETADLLETTVPAANSALQRARATMQQQLPGREDWSAPKVPTDEELDLVRAFIAAHESGDYAASVALVTQDVRVTMPPHPMRFDGIDQIAPLIRNAESMGKWKLVPVTGNRMAGAASYLLAPGDDRYRGFKFDFIRVRDGRIAELTTFMPTLFPQFGLPETLAVDAV